MSYLVNVLGDPAASLQDQPKALQQAYELFAGQGKGSQLASANGTAWGLLNAVTDHVDHFSRARSPDNRLDSAWFGAGAMVKAKAYQEAMKLAA
jgi:hypothetical protein